MNFGEFKQMVTQNLGGRTDIATFVAQWINSCYLDLITRGKFPEIKSFAPIPVPELDGTSPFTTYSGVPDYPYAGNCLFPISLRDTTNNRPLRQRDIRWYDRRRDAGLRKPLRYVTYNRRFYLEPTPDGSYTIQVRFRKTVDIPVLVADSDVPIIGKEWHEGIEIGATYRGARSLQHPDVDRWFRDLKDFVASHSEQYTEEEEDGEYGFTPRL